MDYVKRELPKDALLNAAAHQTDQDKPLVIYGNKFSKFYYDKEYGIRLPDLDTVISASHKTAQIAGEIIGQTITIRNSAIHEGAIVSDMIKAFLFERNIPADVYRYLRSLFGQEQGPHITTLLSILPMDYLELVQTILKCYTGETNIDEKSTNVSVELMTVLSKLEVADEKHEDSSGSNIFYSPLGVSEEGRR